MPKYILYDSGCGLYNSAMHIWWWAMKNTTVCFDAFHIVNRTCTRAFHPRSYSYLDSTNTVGHEQRNAPITSIKKTLRRPSGESYIVILAFRILILNMRTHFREEVEHNSSFKGKYHEIDT